MIHLDTNFLIQALVPGSAAETKLLAWLTAGEDFAVSTIAWSEFLSGPLTPQDELLAQLLLSAPEPFFAAWPPLTHSRRLPNRRRRPALRREARDGQGGGLRCNAKARIVVGLARNHIALCYEGATYY